MTNSFPIESSKVLNLYLLIAQYPMLAGRIRKQMRAELFRRGIITAERLEQEVTEHAVQSQEREGLTDPLWEETAEQWEQRLGLVREHLTDFYFAYNLPRELLIHIIEEIVAHPANGSTVHQNLSLMFNPELAPLEMLLRQAEIYESLPPDERAGGEPPPARADRRFTQKPDQRPVILHPHCQKLVHQR